MVNIQNEIKYRMAMEMLNKLFMDGLLNREEFDTAHSVIISRYSPAAVCESP